MMTSSNGNIFRVTGHLCGEFTGPPVNSPHKGQWRGALMFSLICALNKRLSKQSWGWWFETLSRSLWRHCTPLFKSNRNCFCNVKWWYLFSMYRFEIFCVAWWGLLRVLWKRLWVDVTASRLCEHSNLVRFEKPAAKTPQHGLRYGTILVLYDIINTYERFFCYNWDIRLFHHILFSGQIRYLNIKHELALTTSPFMLICNERCRRTQEREPAHTG